MRASGRTPAGASAPAGIGADTARSAAAACALLGRSLRTSSGCSTQYPGFAEDMDWRYFNAAPA